MSYFDILPAALPPRLEGLKVLTKAGVRGAPGLDDAQRLLAETLLKRRARGPLLDLTAMGGLIAALPDLQVSAAEGSAPALSVLARAGVPARALAPGDPLPADLPGLEAGGGRAAQVALTLAADRGSAYAEAQISWAHAVTRPGGTLWLAGDRDKGFDRYVRRAAALFGSGETVARDGGMRVALLIRRPGPTPPPPAPERYQARGLTVVGLPGVFSGGRLDRATGLLLDTIGETHLGGARVLDLGCGAGVLGAWAALQGAGATLLDADLQSVRSAEATLRASGAAGRVLHSDVDAALTDAPEDNGFDLALSNPPFHVGKGVVLDVAAEFVAAARRRLRPGGTLVLVANDFLPYERLLGAPGWKQPRTLARTDGFKVLSAVVG